MKQKLKELIYLREEELMNIGYSMDRTYLMKKYWKKFYKYCDDQNIEYYDIEIAKKFLKDEYQCLITNNKFPLSSIQKQVIKSILVLDNIEYICDNIKSCTEVEKLNNYYKNELEKYILYSKDIKNNGSTTLKRKRKNTIMFFSYLSEKEILQLIDIKKEIIVNYINSLQDNLISTKIERYWNLREFFNYLNTENILSNNFNYLIPQVRRNRIKTVPTVIEKDDVEQILFQLQNDVNNTPAGYRNYAMLLIIARLGIRGIDVKNLKWKNINWKENTINIVQVKTNNELNLPLPKDVGTAIINYIQNERPLKIRNNEDYIFIKNSYPYTKLSNGYNMKEVINKMFKNCGCDPIKYKKKGLHSF